MIRPIMAVLIAASIILFVWQYAAFTDRIRPEPIQIIETAADGQYDVRVVCTFECQGNAFGSPAVRVRFRDRILLEQEGHVAAGQVLLIENVPDIKQGLNDFLIQVTPVEQSATSPGGAFSLGGTEGAAAQKEKTIARAVNVEILQNGNVISNKLFWSSLAGPFGALVKIEVHQ